MEWSNQTEQSSNHLAEEGQTARLAAFSTNAIVPRLFFFWGAA